MVRSGNKVLVQDRKKKDWPGITFPGGHVEQGESFTEAVIREIREETGLTISAQRLCGIKDWYENSLRYVVLFYKTEQFERTLQSSDEGEVWWEDIDNLPNLSLATEEARIWPLLTFKRARCWKVICRPKRWLWCGNGRRFTKLIFGICGRRRSSSLFLPLNKELIVCSIK